jgi:hypothetical protein
VKTVAGKKIRWAFARVGSSPTARTIRSNVSIINHGFPGPDWSEIDQTDGK